MALTGRSRTVTYTWTLSCQGTRMYSADKYGARFSVGGVSRPAKSQAAFVVPMSKFGGTDNGSDYIGADGKTYRRGTLTYTLDYGWGMGSESSPSLYRSMGTLLIRTEDYDTADPFVPPPSNEDYYVGLLQKHSWTVSGTVTAVGVLQEEVQVINGFSGLPGNPELVFREVGTWTITYALPGYSLTTSGAAGPGFSGAGTCSAETSAFCSLPADFVSPEDEGYPTPAQRAYFNANEPNHATAPCSAECSLSLSGPGMALAPSPGDVTVPSGTVGMGSVTANATARGTARAVFSQAAYAPERSVDLTAQNRVFDGVDTVARPLYFTFGPVSNTDDQTRGASKPKTVTGALTTRGNTRGSYFSWSDDTAGTSGIAWARPVQSTTNEIVENLTGIGIHDASEYQAGTQKPLGESAGSTSITRSPSYYQTTLTAYARNVMSLWQEASQDLESAPFVISSTVPADSSPKASVWTGTNVTLTTTGTALRIAVGSAIGSAWTAYRRVSPTVRSGYRRYRIRIRSVGSANQPFTPIICDQLSGTEPTTTLGWNAFTTGADGEWVERTIDLLDPPPTAAFPGAALLHYSRQTIGLTPDRGMVGFRLDSLAVGKVYELEFVRGERISESLVSVWGQSEALINNPLSEQNLRLLVGFTDGLLTMNQGAASTVAALLAEIAAQPWTGWRADDLAPPAPGRAARAAAGTLTMADIHDSGISANFLEDWGLRSDLSVATDMSATAESPLTLRAAYQARNVFLQSYPCAGDVMGGGAYGPVTPLTFRRSFGSQAMGVYVGSGGGAVQVIDSATGLVKATGAPRSSGTYQTNLPSVPGGSPVVGGTPPTPGYWYLTTAEGKAVTFTLAGTRSDTTWRGGTNLTYRGDRYATQFRTRQRRWFPWWVSGGGGWLSADISATQRVVRSETVSNKIVLGFLSAPPAAPIPESAWQTRTTTIEGMRSCVRYARGSGDSAIVLVYQGSGEAIQRVRTRDEGQSFTVAATVFTTGYFPTFCVTPTGVEHHFSLASESGGAIQGKVLDATGTVIFATFTAVATGAAADSLAAWERGGRIYLAYRKSGDNSVVTVSSADGKTFA